MGGSRPVLGLRLGCSLPVSRGREPQAIVTVSPTRRGQLIQLRRPLENAWPIALPERGKTEKGELALLKSPAFGSSRMALINWSRLLIGWEGETVGGLSDRTNPARARTSHTHRPQAHHTPASMSFFRKGARQATPEQMEGSADQYVHMARMISLTFLSGTNSFFFFLFLFWLG